MALDRKAEFTGTERFEVRRRIGAGGMGVVYEAFDRHRRATVALKTLARFDANNVYRLKREFRALADVSHPNLVDLHELTSHDGRWFFTMELIDGVPFLEYVRGGVLSSPDHGPSAFADTIVPAADIGLTMEDTVRTDASEDASRQTIEGGVEELFDASAEEGETEVLADEATERPAIKPAPVVSTIRLEEALAQLIEAVGFLHDAGKIHRDIKPSNVLVDERGRVVLLDFGLATELYEELLIKSTVQGLVVGTIAYMSPEQGASQSLSPASDWYSVGVMLFEALTGRLPFVGQMYKMLLDKQRLDSPHPREFAPDAPEHLADLCHRMLARDPDERPSRREMMTVLGRSFDSLTPALGLSTRQPAELSCFGRERALERLEQAFTGLGDREAALVYVEGPAGMGKTALVRHFLARLMREENALVIRGRCYAGEVVPFKGIDAMVDTLSRYLRTLTRPERDAILPDEAAYIPLIFPVFARVENLKLPPKGSVSPVILQQHVFRALKKILTRLSVQTMMVLWIDDLHLGDADSARVIADLMFSPDPPPLLMICGFRARGNAGFVVRDALDEAQATDLGNLTPKRIVLGPLDQASSADMARAILSGQAHNVDGEALEAKAQMIAREARGNPLFIHELASYSETIDEEDGQSGKTSDPGIELRFDRALMDRVRRLSFGARRMLEVLAVSPGPRPLDLVIEAAGVPRGDRSALSSLRMSGLSRIVQEREGELVEIGHDRIRQAVTESLSDSIRRAHHLSMVRALTSRDRRDDRALVFHLQSAGSLEEAGRLAPAAAEQAYAAMAFDSAAQLFEMAIALSSHASIPKWRLLGRYADALVASGRSRRGLDVYLEAAETAPKAEAFEFRRVAAAHALRLGQNDLGRKLLIRVLEEVGLKYPSSATGAIRALLMQRAGLFLRGMKFTPRPESDVPPLELRKIDVCWSAVSGLAMADLSRAAYFISVMIRLALAAGEPSRLLRALAAEVVLIGGFGVSEEGTEKANALLEDLAKSQGTEYGFGVAALGRGLTLSMQDRMPLAVAELRKASVLLSGVVDATWESDMSRLLYLESLARMGRFDELPNKIYWLLREASVGGNAFVKRWIACNHHMNLMWLALGRPQEGRRRLAEIQNEDERPMPLLAYFGAGSAALFDLYEGKVDSAWAIARDIRRDFTKRMIGRIPSMRLSTLWMLCRAGLAASLVASKPRPILETVRSGLESLTEINLPTAKPRAEVIRAQLLLLDGKRDRAGRAFESASDHFFEQGMRLEAAAASRRAVELVGVRGAQQHRARVERYIQRARITDSAKMFRTQVPVTVNDAGRFSGG